MLRSWLVGAPRWKRAIVLAVLFGGFMTVFTGRTQDTTWVAAALGGAGGGVVFGLLGSRMLFQQEPELRAVVAAARAAGRREVSRASWRGPVPQEPRVRAAAAAMTAYRLSILERQHRWGSAFYALIIVLAAVLAVTESAWYWLAVGFLGVLLSLHLVLPGHLRRRAELLARSWD